MELSINQRIIREQTQNALQARLEKTHSKIKESFSKAGRNYSGGFSFHRLLGRQLNSGKFKGKFISLCKIIHWSMSLNLPTVPLSFSTFESFWKTTDLKCKNLFFSHTLTTPKKVIKTKQFQDFQSLFSNCPHETFKALPFVSDWQNFIDLTLLLGDSGFPSTK